MTASATDGHCAHLVDPATRAAFCGEDIDAWKRRPRFTSHGCSACARLAAERDFLVIVENNYAYVSLTRFLHQRTAA